MHAWGLDDTCRYLIVGDLDDDRFWASGMHPLTFPQPPDLLQITALDINGREIPERLETLHHGWAG